MALLPMSILQNGPIHEINNPEYYEIGFCILGFITVFILLKLESNYYNKLNIKNRKD